MSNPNSPLIRAGRLALIAAALALGACASMPPDETKYTPPRRVFPVLNEARQTDYRAMVGVYDPYETFNRSMYNFNARFDRYVFLPVVSGYKFVTPEFAQKGVANFFSNLGEVGNLFNNLAQGEMADSGITVSRFVINSTLGIFGLWDPATSMGIYRRPEDFGQTLGRWGVGTGPYIVLPLYGPSSGRDTGGTVVDFAVRSAVENAALHDSPSQDEVEMALNLVGAINTRATTAFRYYETGTPFEYTLIRYLYLEKRRYQIED